jgi:hypothetical protein
VLELGEDLFDRVQVWPYFGKKKSLAPAARMRWHTALALWLPRLSMITMSPGRSVGDLLDIDPEGSPTGSTTSLQRDIANGKPSELEYWNGAVVRLGREAQALTPTHTHASMIACCHRNCMLAARSRTRASPPIVLGYSRRLFGWVNRYRNELSLPCPLSPR